MTSDPDHASSLGFPIVVSVDTMGGDLGPAAVVSGCAKSAKKNPKLGFVLHGPKADLEKLVSRANICVGAVNSKM